MIITAFIYLAGLMIDAILLLLFPFTESNGFPDSVDTAVAWFATYVGKVDAFIPLASVHAFIMFVIAFEISVMTFFIIRWLFGYIPVVGGR